MICANCGRKLKRIASKEAGYGPVCYKKLFGISLKCSHQDNALENANVSYHTLQGQITMEEYMQTVSG